MPTFRFMNVLLIIFCPVYFVPVLPHNFYKITTSTEFISQQIQASEDLEVMRSTRMPGHWPIISAYLFYDRIQKDQPGTRSQGGEGLWKQWRWMSQITQSPTSRKVMMMTIPLRPLVLVQTFVGRNWCLVRSWWAYGRLWDGRHLGMTNAGWRIDPLEQRSEWRSMKTNGVSLQEITDCLGDGFFSALPPSPVWIFCIHSPSIPPLTAKTSTPFQPG